MIFAPVRLAADGSRFDSLSRIGLAHRPGRDSSASTSPAAPPSTAPVDGLRQNTPAVFALTNVRIVPEPGKVIEKGTIVVRDGVIEAVGADVKPPADARVIDLAGKTAYAGLIDAYGEITIAAESATEGAPHWNAQVAPQLDVAEHYAADEALNSKAPQPGDHRTARRAGSRIIKGQSIVVSTGPADNTRAILEARRGPALSPDVPFGRRPRELSQLADGGRGPGPADAARCRLVRQGLGRVEGRTIKLPRPERNDALEALAACLGGNQPAIIDAANEQFFLRADRFAREFGLTADHPRLGPRISPARRDSTLPAGR